MGVRTEKVGLAGSVALGVITIAAFRAKCLSGRVTRVAVIVFGTASGWCGIRLIKRKCTAIPIETPIDFGRPDNPVGTEPLQGDPQPENSSTELSTPNQEEDSGLDDLPNEVNQELILAECLPGEIWLQIFSYLDLKEVAQAQRVCRVWYNVGGDLSLWRSCLEREVIVFSDQQNAPTKEMATFQYLMQQESRIGFRVSVNNLCKEDVEVQEVCWSSDSKRLAAALCDGTVRVWDMEAMCCLLDLEGHTDEVASVDWSPDSMKLATGSNNGTAKIWEAESGICHITLEGHLGRVRTVRWSPDGTRLATGSDDCTVRLWAAESGECLFIMREHTSKITAIAWSPDGTRLASASRGNIIRIWDTNSENSLVPLGGNGSLPKLIKWSPDASNVAWIIDGRAEIWSVESEQYLFTVSDESGAVLGIAWTVDGTQLATYHSNGTIMKIWDVDSHAWVMS